MARKAVLKEISALFVIGLLIEITGATLLHELFEFAGVTLGKFFKGSLDLLFLDGRVLLILGASM